MNRHVKHRHETAAFPVNQLKINDIENVVMRLNDINGGFGGHPAFARAPRNHEFIASVSRQKVDNGPRDAARDDRFVAPGTPSQPDVEAQPDRKSPPEGQGHRTDRARNKDAEASAAAEREADKRSRQSLKHQRAAEARQRFELLEEERELKDNLADFWDERFDKPRRRCVPLAPDSYEHPRARAGRLSPI